MAKIIENVTVTAPGLSDQARAELEDFLLQVAVARHSEEDEQDRETRKGIAEFEAGDFIGIEEFNGRMKALAGEIRKRNRL